MAVFPCGECIVSYLFGSIYWSTMRRHAASHRLQSPKMKNKKGGQAQRISFKKTSSVMSVMMRPSFQPQFKPTQVPRRYALPCRP